MLWNFIAWCCFGLIAGGIARLLYPGPDRLGCLGTILLGVAGSMLGGFLGQLIFGSPDNAMHPAGWIGSIIGALLVLAILRRVAPRPPI